MDAISDRLMYRLQYRNFGAHQTLVTNHTVDTNGSDRAGIRWYELRDTGSGWGIFQQGTFSPDANYRWMGSLAMNGLGDIALGYSISSTSVSPSIRVTGRLDGDLLGQMTQGEGIIVTGNGYQTHSSGRWGDYSGMAVDPVDDCTFWYTQEYYAGVSSASWQTRVGSFKLRNCGPVNIPPSASIDHPSEGSTVSGTITLQISASDLEDAVGILVVEWSLDGGAWQPAPYNGSNGKYEASWDTATSSNDGHTISARANDSGGAIGSDTNNVTVSNGGSTPGTLHVGELDGAVTVQGKSWTAKVTIKVVDSNNNPVGSATVAGNWANGTTGSSSCTTDANGQCTVQKKSIPNTTASVTFSVTNVTHATLSYDSAANADPDSDSNGTTITVVKP